MNSMNTTRVLSYGVLGLPLAFAALPVYVHVPHYYAAVAGMELALLGGILLGVRLLDAVIDPWLGWMADRMQRPAMLALALLPFMLGFVALLNPPREHAAIWLLASLSLTYLGFSAATIAYQAWGANLGADSDARTRLAAAREGFGLAGVILAAALPTLLAKDLSAGIARLSWVLPPLLLIAAATTFGRVAAPLQPLASGLLPLASLRSVLADRAFRTLLFVFIANGVAAALPATLFLFFVTDVLGQEQASGAYLALYFLAGALSLPLWVRIAARYGRPRAWIAAIWLSVIAFAGAGLLGNGDTWAYTAICLASGAALGADLALPAAIAADLGERQRQAGAYFGIWNLAAKLNLALAAGIALPLVTLLGYAPGSGQGLGALTFVYAVVPLAFKALAGALLWRGRHQLEI